MLIYEEEIEDVIVKEVEARISVAIANDLDQFSARQTDIDTGWEHILTPFTSRIASTNLANVTLRLLSYCIQNKILFYDGDAYVGPCVHDGGYADLFVAFPVPEDEEEEDED